MTRQKQKYLEFLMFSDAKRYDNKFDCDPFSTDETGGDIVYKILGIEPSEIMPRVPSIIINKKMRKDQDANYESITEEELASASTADLQSLKHLLEQEDARGSEQKPTKLQSKMKKIKKSSQNLINKRINLMKPSRSMDQEQDGWSLHEWKSYSDISLYTPQPSLRSSAADIGMGLIKKVKRSKQPKYTRSTSEGVGMAALLVRSMMTAPSLDSIAEGSSPPPSKPITAHSDAKSGSTSSLTGKKHHHQNKLNLCVGDSIIDLKASDSNLSTTMSLSSATISEVSSVEDEEEDDESELADNEVVMIDADTISIYLFILWFKKCKR